MMYPCDGHELTHSHGVSRFVLFTSSGEPSLQHLKESWDEAARSQLTEAVPVYHAVVDVEQQPYLADRFSVQGLPAFLLFRNRKVSLCFMPTARFSPVSLTAAAVATYAVLCVGSTHWNLGDRLRHHRMP